MKQGLGYWKIMELEGNYIHRENVPPQAPDKVTWNTMGLSDEENRLNIHIEKYCGRPEFSYNFFYLIPRHTNAKSIFTYF